VTTTSPTVVVVGGVNMDLHLFGGRRPSSGSTLIVDHYLTQSGGKGGNVARAAARLGAKVRLAARVGDDDFGHRAVDDIAADGVDVSDVAFTGRTATGFAAIELQEGRHRTLVFSPGANDGLTCADVEPVLRELAPGDIVVSQGEVPRAVLTQVAERAARCGAHLYFDPTPPERVDRSVLAAAEVITPDRAEAAALVGRADSSELWTAIAAEELRGAGARTVLVKTGATGAVLVGDDGAFRVPTLAVDPVDETGAGDVFLAALTVRRSEGAGWVDAVRFANAASALSVAHSGLLLPTRAAVDTALSTLHEGVVELTVDRSRRTVTG
jgi:ribokinase